METWEQYRDKVKSISIDKMLVDILSIARVQDEIIRLNQEQLQSGIDSQDKVIKTIGGSPYRPYTVKIKRKKGQPTNIVTLKDTGDTYNSMQVIQVLKGWMIKIDYKLHGEDIRDNFDSSFEFDGLTDESLAELVYETILPRLEKIINAKLNV